MAPILFLMSQVAVSRIDRSGTARAEIGTAAKCRCRQTSPRRVLIAFDWLRGKSYDIAHGIIRMHESMVSENAVVYYGKLSAAVCMVFIPDRVGTLSTMSARAWQCRFRSLAVLAIPLCPSFYGGLVWVGRLLRNVAVELERDGLHEDLASSSSAQSQGTSRRGPRSGQRCAAEHSIMHVYAQHPDSPHKDGKWPLDLLADDGVCVHRSLCFPSLSPHRDTVSAKSVFFVQRHMRTRGKLQVF